jgi:hypothetical protein
MDIFTTQLTRFIPVPIKPASLKVKALLKEAGTSKLKEDPDHLENHDYYFVEKAVDNDAQDDDNKGSKSAAQQDEITDEKSADSNSEDEFKEKVKHLDLYV